MLLSELALGVPAAVERVRSTSALVGSVALHRLEELGFIAGERVQVVRRGPGGREPLAVQVGALTSTEAVASLAQHCGPVNCASIV